MRTKWVCALVGCDDVAVILRLPRNVHRTKTTTFISSVKTGFKCPFRQLKNKTFLLIKWPRLWNSPWKEMTTCSKVSRCLRLMRRSCGRKIVTLHFQTFFGEGNKYQLWPKVQKCRNNFVFSFFVKLINVREKLDSVC